MKTSKHTLQAWRHGLSGRYAKREHLDAALDDYYGHGNWHIENGEVSHVVNGNTQIAPYHVIAFPDNTYFVFYEVSS